MDETPDSRLSLRQLTLDDHPRIVALQTQAFPDVTPWKMSELRAQLRRFPEGQVGIEFDGELVATSNCMIVHGNEWTDEHDLDAASANGTIANHDPEGDTLYGIDMVVDLAQRGQRMARRLYDYRKELVRQHNLRRMFIAGRCPGLHAHPELTAEEYLSRVISKELVDSTITVQMAMGFHPVRVLRGYLPEDRESRGHAVLMEWLNPDWLPKTGPRPMARAAAVQYRMRPVDSFAAFEEQCAYYAELAADYRADFLLYPELLTNQLIPLVEPERPALRVRALDRFTEPYIEMFRRLAIRNNVNIIGGTHLMVEDDQLLNVAWLFHRDGNFDRQDKLHITPAESRWWGVSPGSKLEVFDTDAGRIAILICYDVEFPELARIARARGAQILFVPYNTDLRSGHVRVRTCSLARAIENNVYVVTSGMCGGLPSTNWAEIHYARSAILTPSDISFPGNGVAAEANDNVETLLVQDLDYRRLRRMDYQGSVRTWTDRRSDLYRLSWTGDEPFDLD